MNKFRYLQITQAHGSTLKKAYISIRDTDKKQKKKAKILISASFIFAASVGLSLPALKMKIVKQRAVSHLGNAFQS